MAVKIQESGMCFGEYEDEAFVGNLFQYFVRKIPV